MSKFFENIVIYGTGNTSVASALTVKNYTGDTIFNVRNDRYTSGGNDNSYHFGFNTSTSFVDSDNFYVGSYRRDNNTTFAIVGANYPTLKFDSVYSTNTLLQQVAGGDGLQVFTTTGTESVFLRPNMLAVGINVSTGSSSSASFQVVGIDNSSSNYSVDIRSKNNTSLFTIRNDGNVGIGNSNPLSKLSIGILNSVSTATPDSISLGGTFSNLAGANLKFKIYDDGGNIGGFGVSSGQLDYVGWNTSVDHVFYAGTSRLMTLKGSGELGIGTTAPTSKLDISGATGYNQLRLRTSFTPTGSGDTSGNIGDIAWDNNYIYTKTNTGWGRSLLDYAF